MDFEKRFTPEQEAEREAFRPRVRTWIEENSQGVGAPPDAADLTYEQFTRNREFLRALGQRGWYAPEWPKEYGGGGLPRWLGDVIFEELLASIPNVENVHPPGDIGAAVAGVIWKLGTEEQKRRFLPPILRGEVVVWELYTEPEAGSDLPSLKTRAERQGDVFVLNGAKTFVGGHFEADYLFCLAITDPNAPRRANLSVFLVPFGLPGITIQSLDMIAGSAKRTIFFEDVRVPASQLVAREGDGWTAFVTHGDMRVGIGAGIDRDERALAQLLEYCKTRLDNGRPLSSYPHVQEALTQIYMEYQVQRLLRLRNEWMAATQRAFTYEPSQVFLGRKLFDARLGAAMHRAMGPVAAVKAPPWAAFGGTLEYFHRYALLMLHPGGTVEIQKLRMFRGMVGT